MRGRDAVRVEEGEGVYAWHSCFLFLSPSYCAQLSTKSFCCRLHLFSGLKRKDSFYTHKALDFLRRLFLFGRCGILQLCVCVCLCV